MASGSSQRRGEGDVRGRRIDGIAVEDQERVDRALVDGRGQIGETAFAVEPGFDRRNIVDGAAERAQRRIHRVRCGVNLRRLVRAGDHQRCGFGAAQIPGDGIDHASRNCLGARFTDAEFRGQRIRDFAHGGCAYREAMIGRTRR